MLIYFLTVLRSFRECFPCCTNFNLSNILPFPFKIWFCAGKFIIKCFRHLNSAVVCEESKIIDSLIMNRRPYECTLWEPTKASEWQLKMFEIRLSEMVT